MSDTFDESRPEAENVLNTIEATKLPADYVRLLDTATPVPAEMAFLEKRVTISEMINTGLIAIGLAVFGIFMVPFGIAYLFQNRGVQATTTYDYWPLLFGVTLLFAAWFMAGSIRTRWAMTRRQQAGEATRQGIFLTPNTLFEVNEFGYTIIPRSCFQGRDGANNRYTLNNEEKSFRLPG